MEAEGDNGEVAEMFFFDEVILILRLVVSHVCSVWIISKIGIISKRLVVTQVFNFVVVCSRAFVLLDVCRAWARAIPVLDRSNSYFYIIAFVAVEVFLILKVLGLHVNLI